MPELLNSGDYDSIRLKMGFPEGAMNFLPASKIENLKAVEVASEWVASKTTDEGDHAQRAAVAYAAHILLPNSRGELQAAFNAVGGTQAASADGWYRHSQLLLEEAEREIAAISEVGAPESSPEAYSTAVKLSVSY